MLVTPRFIQWTLLVGSIVVCADLVSAQDYPNRVIRIVTTNVGGGSDFVSRQIAQGITGPLGQPVIVDNRGGGIILYDFLAKAPADGYGLVVAGNSFWIVPLLQKIPYDIERDFVPISLVSRQVLVVATHPSVPVKTIKELIALAKGKPGALNYSASTVGGPAQLAAELFKSMAGLNIVHVAYKGIAPQITALISGEVQMTIADAGLVAPHAKSGKLQALAVTSATPSALAPGLPTVAASGLPGYEAVGMTGIWAPTKTPVAILNRLNQEIVRVLKQPEVRDRFLAVGEEIIANTPEEAMTFVKADTTKWSKVIKDAGIRAD